MKKHGFLFICGIILIILVVFVFIVKFSKPNYETITLTKLESIDTGLVHIGDVDNTTKSIFKTYKENYNLKLYNINDVDLDELNELLTDNDVKELSESEGYIFYYESKPVYSFSNDIDTTVLDEVIDKTVYGKLSSDEIVYIEPENGDELVNKINGNDYTIIVLGREDCNYCQMYIPVFNSVAKDNSLDIYYIDTKTYDSTEYEKIQNLALEIPAKCTTSGEATSTKGSFPKPLTLITKKGKTVDCILGYASEDKLTSKLQEYSIIK